jgi:hypothetical protein
MTERLGAVVVFDNIPSGCLGSETDARPDLGPAMKSTPKCHAGFARLQAHAAHDEPYCARI